MTPVQRATPTGEPHDLGDIRTANVDDVHVDRGSSHAVMLGENEAAEAVQVTLRRQLPVERFEQRAPRLVQGLAAA